MKPVVIAASMMLFGAFLGAGAMAWFQVKIQRDGFSQMQNFEALTLIHTIETLQSGDIEKTNNRLEKQLDTIILTIDDIATTNTKAGYISRDTLKMIASHRKNSGYSPKSPFAKNLIKKALSAYN